MSAGQMSSSPGRPDLGRALMLDFPQRIAVYDTYAEAEKAVDYLADNEFPVGNLCIVGTDLKTIERVQGRKTWQGVLLQGLMSGLFTGALIGLMLSMFTEGGMLDMMLVGLGLGAAFGIVNGGLIHSLSGGRRDFNSITQTIASRYEVLGEHKVAARAREMLLGMPGERARQWSGNSGVVTGHDASAGHQPTPNHPHDQAGSSSAR